jgi:DNA helicase-2/ATP-dependent DNA helicase PcrA
MSLEVISDNNRKRENEIQEELYQCIDKKESILFNSGAGAGKTYALKECLKYVIRKYGNELKYRNQKVICITYTNVATNEIKSRLGNTNTVLVSTIHERIWELIKNHQNELIKIHIEK